MAKIDFTRVPDDLPDTLGRPSDHDCVCDERDPNDHFLTVDEGTPAVTHGVCGKRINDDGYIEDWNTVAPIPVRVEFIDEGMNHYTGEHNGFWWEISPRAEPDL